MTRDEGSLKVVFKGTRMLGVSTATLSNDWLHKRFKELYKERTLESSVKTLRSLEVKGELSRFKLERKYKRCCRIYIYGDAAHGPSSVRGGKAKTGIRGKIVCVIEKKKAV